MIEYLRGHIVIVMMAHVPSHLAVGVLSYELAKLPSQAIALLNAAEFAILIAIDLSIIC